MESFMPIVGMALIFIGSVMFIGGIVWTYSWYRRPSGNNGSRNEPGQQA